METADFLQQQAQSVSGYNEKVIAEKNNKYKKWYFVV